MKKILIFAALFAALLSCEKSPNGTSGGDGGGSTSDRIAVTPKSRTFAKAGATCDVNVTSSSDWTLVCPESVDWVTPSATEGKSGSRVVFTAKPNPGKDQRGPVVFTFKVGSQTATFTAIQDGDKPVSDKFELRDPSQASLEIDALGSDREVIRINTEYKNITREVTYLNGTGWIEAGDVSEFEGSMCCFLKIKRNDGAERKATIRFSANGKQIEVNITQNGATQEPQPGGGATLEFANPTDANLTFGKDQQIQQISLETDVPDANLMASVEYENGNNWIYLAMGGAIGGKSFGFVVFPNETGAERRATIVIKALDNSASELRMNIVQKGI